LSTLIVGNVIEKNGAQVEYNVQVISTISTSKCTQF